MSHFHQSPHHHGPYSHSHIPPYSPYSPYLHSRALPPPPSSNTAQHIDYPYPNPSYGYHHAPPPPPPPSQYNPPLWPTTSFPFNTAETPRDLAPPARETKWGARGHDNGWSGYHEERQGCMREMEDDRSVASGFHNHAPYPPPNPPPIRPLEETQHIPIPYGVHLPSWAAHHWILALRPTPSNLPTREITISYTRSLLPGHTMHIHSRPLTQYDPRAWPLEFYENAYTIPYPPAWRTPAQRDARPGHFKAWEAKEHNRAMAADGLGRWTRWVRTVETGEGLVVRWKAKPRDEIERKTGAVMRGWKSSGVGPAPAPVLGPAPPAHPRLLSDGSGNSGGSQKRKRGRTWAEWRRRKNRTAEQGDTPKPDDREGRMRSSSTPSVTAASTGFIPKANLEPNDPGPQMATKRKAWEMTADGGETSSSTANAEAAATGEPAAKVPRWEGATGAATHVDRGLPRAPAWSPTQDPSQVLYQASPNVAAQPRGDLGGMSQELAAALEALVPAESVRAGLDDQSAQPAGLESSVSSVEAVARETIAVSEEEVVGWLDAMGAILAERPSGAGGSAAANDSGDSVAPPSWSHEGSGGTSGGPSPAASSGLSGGLQKPALTTPTPSAGAQPPSISLPLVSLTHPLPANPLLRTAATSRNHNQAQSLSLPNTPVATHPRVAGLARQLE
ncbi:hypothetical protein IAT38_005566 [Cryptococcus sp. DSM 104549]